MVREITIDYDPFYEINDKKHDVLEVFNKINEIFNQQIDIIEKNP